MGIKNEDIKKTKERERIPAGKKFNLNMYIFILYICNYVYFIYACIYTERLMVKNVG